MTITELDLAIGTHEGWATAGPPEPMLDIRDEAEEETDPSKE